MTTQITATFAAGNFEADDCNAEAARFAEVFRTVAMEYHPGADITITVLANTTGGSKTMVLIDGESDERAAEYLNTAAEMRAY